MKILTKAASVLIAILMFYGCSEMQRKADTNPVNSGVRGQVIMENQGAAPDVFVYAYESGFNDLRVPTKWISAPTAADGTYVLNLPPGSYYIVARKRSSGDPKGYLVKGDYEGKNPTNPVAVKQGEFTTVNMSISMLSGNFLLAPYLPAEGEMGISGNVRDTAGKPMPGAFVLLYADREMVGLPAFLSKPTGKDGEYRLFVTKPGIYYVAARIKYGGLPRKGEPYGTYDKDTEHKVQINPKVVMNGVDINLGPFPFDLAKPVPPVK